MTKGFFIVGTDTGVGKTVITAGLVGALKAKGIDAAPFKPVQSGAVPGENGLVALDVEFYKKVANLANDKFNTYSLQPPLAPSLAAELSNVTINMDNILEDYYGLANKYEMLIVEGAGGLYVPLQGTSFLLPDLIKVINLPLIIVARPNLGTINHTVMTVKCAQNLGFSIKGIIYNGYDEENISIVEKTNHKIIEEITQVPTIGQIPKGKDIDTDNGEIGNTLELIQNNINFDILIN